MPEISRFFGIVIQMYNAEHLPPHFHATYAGTRVMVAIAPPVPLEGRLSPRVLALIVEWSTLHRAELLDNWERLGRHQPPRRISPLE